MVPKKENPLRFDFAPPIFIVRELMAEYACQLNLDLSFQNFDAELEQLPGKYADPRGCLLVVFAGSQPAACGAFRPLASDICEMKRLYIRPEFRGQGLGRQLAQVLMEHARAKGYRAMRLDTLSTMLAAVRLYESLGFRRIPAYNPCPLADCIYFEAKLCEDL